MDPLRGEQPTTDGGAQGGRSTQTTNSSPPSSDSHQDQLEEELDNQCIYTYKGGTADLPASFWEFEGQSSLDTGSSNPPSTSSGASSSKSPNGSLLNGGMKPAGSNSDQLYSPDNDFLEMDFDPGEEVEEEAAPVLQPPISDTVDGGVVATSRTILPSLEPEPCQEAPPSNVQPAEPDAPAALHSGSQPSQSPTTPAPSTASPPHQPTSRPRPQLNLSSRLVKSNTLPKMGVGGSPAAGTPTAAPPPISITRGGTLSYSLPTIESGAREPGRATLLLPSSSSACSGIRTEPSLHPHLLGDVMLWSREEAASKATGQIGVSACGATAVVNVLSALGHPPPSIESLNSAVKTRLRAEDGDLTEYLVSRSVAGATHEDLMRGLDSLTSGTTRSRFFRVRRDCTAEEFSSWLLGWVCRGAIPILTRNLQAVPSSDPLPDSWHHQMLYGLGPGFVYLTNPLEAVPIHELLPQLTSESLLLVRREDVVPRMRPRTDLRKLARIESRWNGVNVLGQVANMLLEQSPLFSESSAVKRTRTGYVTIPYCCSGGVMLCISKESPYVGEFENLEGVIGGE